MMPAFKLYCQSPEKSTLYEWSAIVATSASISTRAVLSVVASVVEGSKQGDISDAVKSRLLV